MLDTSWMPLRAGKHVFVEKPLCLTLEELKEISEVWESPLGSKVQGPKGKILLPLTSDLRPLTS